LLTKVSAENSMDVLEKFTFGNRSNPEGGAYDPSCSSFRYATCENVDAKTVLAFNALRLMLVLFICYSYCF
jgi:hypothetical protein